MKKLSDSDRTSLVKAFRAARGLLWNGGLPRPKNHKEYICDALRAACASDLISLNECSLAKNLIHSRLCCFSLDQWLLRQGVPGHHLTFRRVQAHRHAWVDQLIAEFSAPAP